MSISSLSMRTSSTRNSIAYWGYHHYHAHNHLISCLHCPQHPLLTRPPTKAPSQYSSSCPTSHSQPPLSPLPTHQISWSSTKPSSLPPGLHSVPTPPPSLFSMPSLSVTTPRRSPSILEQIGA
ncbi:hypothetical protein BGX38DRAFT_372801 [Terfezia claveryi]|nr:hypothetical protein BGX38DRAFT_372801 [Terfezia claveryi]